MPFLVDAYRVNVEAQEVQLEGDGAAGLEAEAEVAGAIEHLVTASEREAGAPRGFEEDAVGFDQLVTELEARQREVRLVVVAVAPQVSIEPDAAEHTAFLCLAEAEPTTEH